MNDTFRRFFPTRAPALFLLPFLVAACIDDPTGPSALSIRTVGASPDSMWIGAPGEPIPTGVAIRVTSLQNGEPVAGATVTWESFGQNGAVVHASAQSDAKGLATAVWQLGTSAGEQQLLVSVRSGQRTGELKLRALAVPHVVAQLRISVDSLTVVRLGDSLPISVVAVDPYGNVFAPSASHLSSSDSTVGTVVGSLFVAGPKRGITQLEIVSDYVTARVPLRVVQQVASIAPHTNALTFTSLGAQLPIRYVVVDDRGRLVADTTATLSLADTTVAQLSDTIVRASKPGSTELRFSVGTATTTIPIAVQQRIASLRLHRDTVRFDALRDTTTIQLVATDSLGFSVLNPELVYELSDAQVVTLAGSSLLEATNPGVSALTLRDPITGVSATMPIVVQQRVSTIQVSPITFDALGDTVPIGAIAVDRLGSEVAGASLVYSINDPEVATIESGGRLRSHGEGHAVVTVSDLDNGTTGSAEIVVSQRVASLSLSADSLAFDALGDSVPLSFVARDRLGTLALSATASCSSSDAAVAAVELAGIVRSVSNGSSVIVCRSTDGPADTLWARVEQRVTKLSVAFGTLRFASLNAEQFVGATAYDRLGTAVEGAPMSYDVEDPTIASVDSGRVRALKDGTTFLTVASTGLSIRTEVVVHQVVWSLGASSVIFDALDDTATVTVIPRDSLGSPVAGTSLSYSVSDTAIVHVSPSGQLRSVASGQAVLTVRDAGTGVAADLPVTVQQRATTLQAQLDSTQPIITVPRGAVIRLSCTALDRNGYAITNSAPLVTSSAGTVDAGTCNGVRTVHSGFDTLLVSLDGQVARVPVVIALQTVVPGVRGDFLLVDSMPVGSAPWAPTVWRNPAGQVELLTTLYYPDTLTPGFHRGHLHRYLSDDGSNFRYGGVVVRRDSTPCSLNGSGIENVVIVPASDSTGWRMLYSGGSFVCYGWQVFSAWSPDGITWTKETGVRLSNGGTVPPAPSTPPPYPVGEGMVVDRLSSGEFRMIVSSFEHIQPAPKNIWQITEWRSTDQRDWTYQGTVLSTREMPSDGQGSVYSPSIVEFSPGLWRMFFTADNRGTPGWRSAIWSAVSTDRQNWTIEGKVLGDAGTTLYYTTVLDNQLFFLRQDNGGSLRLASTTIQMP